MTEPAIGDMATFSGTLVVWNGQQWIPVSSNLPPQRVVNNGAGTTALVFGILAIVIFWIPVLGLLCAFVAILAGCVGVGNANRGESTNKGSAITGLVFGCINIGISVLFIIYFVVMMNQPH